MTFDRSKLSAVWQRAFDFVELQAGGRIVAAERQPRWRPAWFLDIEREGGEVASVYFRGARSEDPQFVQQIRHECTCLELLEKHGVPVPHVYGFCEDPVGIVMDKAPGRFNLATAESEAERRSVIDHYMQLLVDIHDLPLAEFEAAGLKRPESMEALALGDFDAWERAYRAAKTRPEPLIEFAIDWLKRKAPVGRERVNFLVGDSGQFLFDAGRVTAVIDVELAYLGDPAADLGGLMSRDLSEPLGDLNYAIRKYEEISGEAVDRRVVHYHGVRFGIVTPLATAQTVADPAPTFDYVQYLLWYLVYSRCPLEVIAHMEGVEVPAAERPQESDTPLAIAHDALRVRLDALERGEVFEAYQLEAIERLATYLRRADRFGASIREADFAEAAELLGRRPVDERDRDTRLEELVASNSGDLDAAFLRYFIRRVQREEFVLEPVAKELLGARMQILE